MAPASSQPARKAAPKKKAAASAAPAARGSRAAATKARGKIVVSLPVFQSLMSKIANAASRSATTTTTMKIRFLC